MKQKATRIALALLVLLVWGAVIARAFQRPKATDAAAIPAPLPPEVMDRDTMTAMQPLHLAHDPFLDGSTGMRRTAVSPDNNTAHSTDRGQRPASPAPKAPEAPRAWPKVAYHGIVSNANDAARCVGFLSIDGAHHMLKPGAQASGLVVLEVRRDSVVVTHDGERRTFGKQ